MFAVREFYNTKLLLLEGGFTGRKRGLSLLSASLKIATLPHQGVV
jgi:hypothetical protein